MPTHRAFFATAQAAQDAGVAAIARLNASLLADAELAGQSPATATPCASLTLLEAPEPLPVGALPTTSAAYSRARMRVATPGQGSEDVVMVLPVAELPVPAHSTAAATVTSSTKATLTITATVPAAVQLTGYPVSGSPISVTTGLVLVERYSGKQFTITATSSITYPATTKEYVITETDSTQRVDLTFGAELEFVSPPAGILRATKVVLMASKVVADATPLTASTGRKYKAVGPQTISGATYLTSGYLTRTIEVFAVDGSGNALNDGASLPVGAVLTFDTPIVGIKSTGVLASVGGATVPVGSPMTSTYDDPTTGTVDSITRTFATVAAVTIGDGCVGTVTVLADAAGAQNDIPVGSTITFAPTITGVTAGATTTAFTPAGGYPMDLGKQLIGAPIEWKMRVKRGLDERYALTVYTEPLGS